MVRTYVRLSMQNRDERIASKGSLWLWTNTPIRADSYRPASFCLLLIRLPRRCFPHNSRFNVDFAAFWVFGFFFKKGSACFPESIRGMFGFECCSPESTQSFQMWRKIPFSLFSLHVVTISSWWNGFLNRRLTAVSAAGCQSRQPLWRRLILTRWMLLKDHLFTSGTLWYCLCYWICWIWILLLECERVFLAFFYSWDVLFDSKILRRKNVISERRRRRRRARRSLCLLTLQSRLADWLTASVFHSTFFWGVFFFRWHNSAT